jgi:tRNA uridine 5-carboxymethylaminomethyl modification enzyme
VARTAEALKRCWVNPSVLPAADAERLLGKAIEHEYNLADLLRRPGVDFDGGVGGGGCGGCACSCFT